MQPAIPLKKTAVLECHAAYLSLKHKPQHTSWHKAKVVNANLSQNKVLAK
jgi:hypothetical protein